MTDKIDKRVDNSEQAGDKSATAADAKPKRGSIFKSFVIPFGLLALAFIMHPLLTAKSIIGNRIDLSDCTVMRRDVTTNRLVPTNETIEIHQVDYGVKMVQAKTFEGAVFGLGFLHGRDRLWQLQFYRHLAQGRMSEIFGAETVIIDKFIRTIGLTRGLEAYMETISQEDLDTFSNYAAGINKVVENIVVYPPEFQILWSSFEPWEPRDSASSVLFIQMCLSTDWFSELLRERLLEVYDKELVDALIPYRPEDF